MCSECVGDAVRALAVDPSSGATAFGSAVAASYCAVCGKSAQEVKRLLERNAICVCNECAVMALSILVEEERPLSGPVNF